MEWWLKTITIAGLTLSFITSMGAMITESTGKLKIAQVFWQIGMISMVIATISAIENAEAFHDLLLMSPVVAISTIFIYAATYHIIRLEKKK